MQFSQLAFRAAPDSRLGEAVKLLDESDRFEAQAREEQELGFGDPDYSKSEASSRKESGLSKLRTCLSEDASLDRELAGAMSRRIEQEQYRREAVAFELFQNADDAYLEANMESGIFCSDFSQGEFRFAHWGRAINESVSDDPLVVAGQKRDLIKMLVLHGSDKGVAHT